MCVYKREIKIVENFVQFIFTTRINNRQSGDFAVHGKCVRWSLFPISIFDARATIKFKYRLSESSSETLFILQREDEYNDNFWIFNKIKTGPKDNHFYTIENIKTNATIQLGKPSKQKFHCWFHQRFQRWDTWCISKDTYFVCD